MQTHGEEVYHIVKEVAKRGVEYNQTGIKHTAEALESTKQNINTGIDNTKKHLSNVVGNSRKVVQKTEQYISEHT